ncbi:hypothetical protein MOTE_25240 [Moorella thermoacetica]|uniref:Uncharacterized protein n=1 Tax=Neomoorella thermoacetica TaxID=1525 RepID=A0A1J5NHJ3_NEOTH|nr:hypothetical protein MOTE_25240 [Moorella thermoacetica]
MLENEGQPRPPYHPYDKGYRQLLADKRVFLELLKTLSGKTGWRLSTQTTSSW